MNPSKPCTECPWRKDVAPGRFPPERYRALARTAYDNATIQFACHKSPEDREFICAGFLLMGSAHNLGTRFGILRGEVSPNNCQSPYPLHGTYRDMAIANGVDADDPILDDCRDDTQWLIRPAESVRALGERT